MSIKVYSNLVSPFNQTKVIFHQDKLCELREKKIVVPVTCEIDLTDGFCNNKCSHCFFGTNHKATPVFLETEVVKKVIYELKINGTKGIEFSGGGEPTTHPDVVEIITYALDIGFDVGLVTNGLLLDKLEHIAHKLSFIRISLDAASKEIYKIVHGVSSFDKVLRNIKRVVSLGKDNIGIGFLIVPENYLEIEKAASMAMQLGVRFIQFRPASLTYEVDERLWISAEESVRRAIQNNNPSKLQIFNAGVKWKHLNGQRNYKKCTTSSMVAVIKANGDIPLCVLKRNEKDSIIGNIYDGGFMKHWNSKKHEKKIDEINLNKCRKPCKHDSYNIVFEAMCNDLFHKNFI